MKYLSALILLLIGACAYLYINPVVKPGTYVVSQAFIDSMQVIANTPADTVRDTTYVPKEVRVPIKVPYPVYSKDSVNFYSDTTETNDIVLVIRDSIKGLLLNRVSSYTLKVPRYITNTVTKFIPVPIMPANKDPVYYKYLEVGFGYGLSVGGGVEYKKFRLGAEVVRVNTSTAVMLKTGFKF